MVAAVVAVAGAAATAYGANQQAKAAKKAQKSADSAADRQAEIAQEQLDWQKSRYNEWHDSFMPVLNDLRDEAYASRNPDYASVSADVNSAFDTAQGVNQRQMERYGIKPTDGAVSSANTAYGLGRATATVMGRQSERKSVMQERYNKLSELYRLGEGMRGDSAAGVAGAAGAMGNVYGSQADRYDHQADASGSAAGEMTGAAIRLGMGAANAWANRGASNPSQVSSSPSWGMSSGTTTPWGTSMEWG